ncbi:MAG: wax ester/triacylglycerol synthase family O-acyltransferase [Candidatus Competibacter sp.]|nr:wax ester/triacylglycerol synthase family O-acyltransferase [Candidatus Competibacter sp.]
MEPQQERVEAALAEPADGAWGVEAPAIAARPVLAEPLTGNDVTWARMDAPGQPMVVTLVLLLDRPLAEERLKATLRDRLLSLARFRQRVCWTGGRYRWVEGGPLDWRVHLQRVRLPEPSDQRTLEERVGRWAGEPLDFDFPLWRCFLVENYGTGCALVFRVHHCIVDGVALLRVFLSLTDPTAEGGPATPAQRREQARLAAKTSKRLASPAGLAGKLRWSVDFGAALLRQLFLGPDARTALRGTPNGHKRVAWSAPVPLSDIAAIRQRLGGRLNDVMLTAVAGALGRYLRARGETRPALIQRLMVPVNMRPYQEEIRLGNEFAVILLELPLGIADPVRRLAEVRARMDRIKGTPEVLANRLVLNVAGWLPVWVERLALRWFGRKATVAMTNVPGPEQTLYLAGAPVGRVLAWVPQIAGMGIGVSVLSYAGAVTVGITTDSGVVADPWELVAGFEAEMALLAERALAVV